MEWRADVKGRAGVREATVWRVERGMKRRVKRREHVSGTCRRQVSDRVVTETGHLELALG